MERRGLRTLAAIATSTAIFTSSADLRLELVTGAPRDDLSMVDDGDGVGQFVGFLEVLRCEEERDTLPDESADDVPHIPSRLRGSRPVVGSSRMSSCGRPISALARSSRRRIPPE